MGPESINTKKSTSALSLARTRQLLRNITLPELLRYLMTGGLNAILTFLIFVVGLYVLQIHYLLALIAAFLAGTIFTYVLNFVWVFRPETDFTFRHRFFKHLIPNVGTFLINLAVLYLLVDYWGGDPFLCQVLLMIAVVTANFLFAKYWAFRR
ncbi:MAG: GtrA family protein [Xanthomonadales bacterium]|mgnify:CR=1 FL=1|nr:GtrA family protein [Xanthomonadales bacterium]